MDGKIILLLTSVIAVGMFVLPSTMALYTGQHEFVEGGEVECDKCHVTGKDLIAKELENGTVHEGMGCGGCHGPAGGLVDLTGNVTEGTVTGHAAGVGINCIGCHGGDSPVTTYRDGQVNVSAELELSTAAHKYLTFNVSGDATGDINDKDLVCVACHTKVNVDLINVSLTPDTGNITIEGGGDGNWTYDQID